MKLSLAAHQPHTPYNAFHEAMNIKLTPSLEDSLNELVPFFSKISDELTATNSWESSYLAALANLGISLSK